MTWATWAVRMASRLPASNAASSAPSSHQGETGKPTSITAVKIVAGNLHETLVEAAVDEARKAARHAAKPVFAPPIATFSGRKRATVEDTVDGLDIALELDEHPQQSLAYMVSLLGEPTFVIASIMAVS